MLLRLLLEQAWAAALLLMEKSIPVPIIVPARWDIRLLCLTDVTAPAGVTDVGNVIPPLRV